MTSVFFLNHVDVTPFGAAAAISSFTGSDVFQLNYVYTPKGAQFGFAHLRTPMSSETMNVLKSGGQCRVSAPMGWVLIGEDTSGGLDLTKGDKIVEVFFTTQGTYYRTSSSLHVWDFKVNDWVRTTVQPQFTLTPDVEMEDDFTPKTPIRDVEDFTPKKPVKKAHKKRHALKRALAEEFKRALFM